MLFSIVLLLVSVSTASTDCVASSPWSRCSCGPQDFPQGIYQLVTGFVSPQTIKSVSQLKYTTIICTSKTSSKCYSRLEKSLVGFIDIVFE
ncbi:hypothetical protein Y032_0005g2466 [Ancylostoma ceylanicum]|uniref:Uncharacterized protein n=1 Tax=Ancylostoma ceylanicum TaxID=53326 RepID=A0A016VRE7_9BILA|nr:hypothetical protein Y032_0005g2466 [Ancylostoma ceylanicum]